MYLNTKLLIKKIKIYDWWWNQFVTLRTTFSKKINWCNVTEKKEEEEIRVGFCLNERTWYEVCYRYLAKNRCVGLEWLSHSEVRTSSGGKSIYYSKKGLMALLIKNEGHACMIFWVTNVCFAIIYIYIYIRKTNVIVFFVFFKFFDGEAILFHDWPSYLECRTNLSRLVLVWVGGCDHCECLMHVSTLLLRTTGMSKN